MKTTDYTIEPCWQDDEAKYTKTRAIRELTANCPCDPCEWMATCKTECRTFKLWVATGKVMA